MVETLGKKITDHPFAYSYHHIGGEGTKITEGAVISIGYICNNSCKFCSIPKNCRNLYPQTERLKEEIKFLRNVFNSIVFTGGEVTIRKDFFDLIDFTKKIGFKITIQSNGRMFSYCEFCNKIVNYGVEVFGVDLHGHNDKTHDFLTSVNGSFKQVVSGIMNLKRLGQFVLSNTVITSFNYKFIPKIANLLIGLGVDQIQFGYVCIFGQTSDNKNWIVPRITEMLPYLRKGLDLCIKYKKDLIITLLPYCFMKGYERFVIMEEKKYLSKSRLKEVRCNVCKYYKICCGPQSDYLKLFGSKEFKPVF
ncbi:MAG: radical SAM protein [Candidatus Omnitrophica bacterium]|nr:radical SAM protein [Candidatus Omnitrophota bacterium]MDD5352612.1 radical SAM protein [Candidatus Omnitrophota bacterium]MDD5550210.1 radical SAM protein [Candidatus Omnitrophota bacterium]